eukprot:scaffold327_cov257-Pinguiococcus_pyrenoidosus.AAC.11
MPPDQPGQEGGAEAGREGGLGLLDAPLRAGDLGRVARQEVVHGLLRGELGDGREDAEGVAGEEDHVVRVATHGHRVVVLDVVQRVRHAAVLGLAGVEVVRGVVGSLEGDILQQRIALDGPVDLRLVLLGEVDGLGVAAALEVEDAVLVPAVLVVADEVAVRVGAERGLSGATEAEEEGGVAVLALVGRAVHGHDALEREPVVHHGEDALLHLAAVVGPADDRDLLLEVEGHEHVAVQAVLLPVLVADAARVDDGVVGGEVGDLVVGLRADEHVANEVVLPGHLGDEADVLARGRVGAAEAVEDVHLLRVVVVVVEHLGVELVEDLGSDATVHVAPPQVALAGRLLHNPLVLGAAARELARVDGHRAVGGGNGLLVGHLLFKKGLVGRVAHHGHLGGEPELIETDVRHGRMRRAAGHGGQVPQAGEADATAQDSRLAKS